MREEHSPVVAKAEHSHNESYAMYVMIWLTLLVLTQFTVLAGQMQLGALGIIIASVVTPAKASLVLFFFMHLGKEHLVFKVMFLFAIVTLVFTIAFTFFDYSFR